MHVYIDICVYFMYTYLSLFFYLPGFVSIAFCLTGNNRSQKPVENASNKQIHGQHFSLPMRLGTLRCSYFSVRAGLLSILYRLAICFDARMLASKRN